MKCSRCRKDSHKCQETFYLLYIREKLREYCQDCGKALMKKRLAKKIKYWNQWLDLTRKETTEIYKDIKETHGDPWRRMILHCDWVNHMALDYRITKHIEELKAEI